MKGKSYFTRKDHPEGDFYSTPRSLVSVAWKILEKEFWNKNLQCILEPCSGQKAIVKELEELGFSVYSNDLYHDADKQIDFLKNDFIASAIITNPPFSLWDEFVIKAKEVSFKFMFIGRLNYFGTVSRQKKGLWEGLKAVYPFNRYVDFRTPYRDDGLFHVGGMQSAWFLWEKGYSGKTELKVLDVQKWAKLGQYKEKK